MIDIKIYGAETSTYQYVKKCVVDYLMFHKLDYHLEEINDVQRFIKDNISSVPYVLVDGKPTLELSNIDYFKSDLKKLYETISHVAETKKLRKVLIPVDFSEFALGSLFFAKSFCKNKHYHADLLYIHHPNLEEAQLPGGNDDLIQDKFSQLVGNVESDFIGDFSNHMLVKTIVKSGFAAEQIIEMSHHYEVIIMGSHGSTHIIDRLLGSVSQHVAAHAHCPTILVPKNVKFYKFNSIKTIGNIFINDSTFDHRFEHIAISPLHEEHLEHLSESLAHEDTIYAMSKIDFQQIFSFVPDDKLLSIYKTLMSKGKPVMVV